MSFPSLKIEKLIRRPGILGLGVIYFLFCTLSVQFVLEPEKISTFWIRIYVLITLLSGAVMLLLMMIQRMRNNKIEAFNEKHQNMMEVMGSGIIVVNEDGQITDANQGLEKMFGYERGALIGKPVEILLKEEFREKHVEYRKLYLKNPEVRRMGAKMDIKALTKDRRELSIEVTLSPIRNGDKVEVVANVVNVTHRVSIEKELQDAVEKANESGQAKMQFLANMSHEIRTPLNGIMSSIMILEDLTENDDHKRIIEVMSRSSKNLMHIVNDILDLSKIEAGKFVYEKVQCNFRELIDDSLKLHEHQCEEKGIALELDIDSSFPTLLKSDPNRVKQVLNNLISNAVKFTEKGYVRLVIRHVPKEGDLVNVIMIVKDSGIGMTEEQLARIFMSFEQADTSITRKYGGTGLGTTLVKKIIEGMGGTIHVVSEPDTGSTFTVEFSSEVCEYAARKKMPKRYRQYHKKILVAEDSETNAYLITVLLRKMAIEVKVYCNGQELLDHIDQEHDAVITDIQMPVMDGITLKKKLDDMNYDKKVIAMTANIFEADTDQYDYEKYGFHRVIAKPYELEEITAALDALFPNLK